MLDIGRDYLLPFAWLIHLLRLSTWLAHLSRSAVTLTSCMTTSPYVSPVNAVLTQGAV